LVNRLAVALFHRREGRIVVALSVVYGALGMLSALAPSIAPVTGFYGWLCGFMPLPLLIMYLKVGGFRQDYRSSWFDTSVIVFVALVPILMKTGLLAALQR
jgi:hypothetical protein